MMKRTAKWHRPLTLRQLRHLKDMGYLNLARFMELRAWQERQRLKYEAEGYAPGIAEPCWECREIARRLKAANYGMTDRENHQSNN